METLQQDTDKVVWDILWASLDGGDHDLATLRQEMRAEDSFDDVGLDSLDVTDFFLRLQDHFKIAISREDYAELISIQGVQTYVRNRNAI